MCLYCVLLRGRELGYIPLMCRLLTDITVLLQCTSVCRDGCLLDAIAVCCVFSRIQDWADGDGTDDEFNSDN